MVDAALETPRGEWLAVSTGLAALDIEEQATRGRRLRFARCPIHKTLTDFDCVIPTYPGVTAEPSTAWNLYETWIGYRPGVVVLQAPPGRRELDRALSGGRIPCDFFVRIGPALQQRGDAVATERFSDS